MKIWEILVVVAVLAIAATLVFLLAGAPSTHDVAYTWTPPIDGSPVDHYVVELSVDGGPFTLYSLVPGETVTIPEAFGHEHVVRVAGVDAQDRQGAFSENSDPYTPDARASGQLR